MSYIRIVAVLPDTKATGTGWQTPVIDFINDNFHVEYPIRDIDAGIINDFEIDGKTYVDMKIESINVTTADDLAEEFSKRSIGDYIGAVIMHKPDEGPVSVHVSNSLEDSVRQTAMNYLRSTSASLFPESVMKCSSSAATEQTTLEVSPSIGSKVEQAQAKIYLSIDDRYKYYSTSELIYAVLYDCQGRGLIDDHLLSSLHDLEIITINGYRVAEIVLNGFDSCSLAEVCSTLSAQAGVRGVAAIDGPVFDPCIRTFGYEDGYSERYAIAEHIHQCVVKEITRALIAVHR